MSSMRSSRDYPSSSRGRGYGGPPRGRGPRTYTSSYRGSRGSSSSFPRDRSPRGGFRRESYRDSRDDFKDSRSSYRDSRDSYRDSRPSYKREFDSQPKRGGYQGFRGSDRGRGGFRGSSRGRDYDRSDRSFSKRSRFMDSDSSRLPASTFNGGSSRNDYGNGDSSRYSFKYDGASHDRSPHRYSSYDRDDDAAMGSRGRDGYRGSSRYGDRSDRHSYGAQANPDSDRRSSYNRFPSTNESSGYQGQNYRRDYSSSRGGGAGERSSSPPPRMSDVSSSYGRYDDPPRRY